MKLAVAGLLSALNRKTAEAIAVAATPSASPQSVRTDPDDYSSEARRVHSRHQCLLHTIGRAKWDDRAVRYEAARIANESLHTDEQVEQLIIDDTGWLKQGKHSAGVQRQYTGSAGKIANCQVGVSVVACTSTAQFPIDFALYLPEEWLTPQARASVHIPDHIIFKTKPELAVDMVKEILHAEVMSACTVSADSAYGDSSQFRAAIRKLGCSLAVGIKPLSNAWSVDAGGSRRGPVTSVRAIGRRMKYRRIAWRDGTKGTLVGHFGARRVVMEQDAKCSDEPEPLWLVTERTDEKPKYYLVSGPAEAKLKDLVRVLKQRFRTERAYQDAKNEVGLADYQGRSFVGWHHHVSAAVVACAFLFSEQKRRPRPRNTARPRQAVRTPERLLRHFPESFPTLRRMISSIVSFILPRPLLACIA